MAITQSMTLRDGREVDVFIGGAPNGFALVMHHGSPSDGTAFADWDASCDERGLRLICASRPGYATSARLPGRDIAQAAPDTAELLEQLGHREFLVAGASGGGPHALACGAVLADRCKAVATLAGVGPFGASDLDFLSGMAPENVDEFGAALKGETALRSWMTEFAEPFRQVTADDIVEAFGELVAPIDARVLREGYAEHMAREVRRALEPGFDGWIDDDIAFTKSWGFDLSGMSVPVTVWQGDLDRMVPAAHGGWLVDHIPGAEARMVKGHGHISLVTDHRDEILDDLLKDVQG